MNIFKLAKYVHIYHQKKIKSFVQMHNVKSQLLMGKGNMGNGAFFRVTYQYSRLE